MSPVSVSSWRRRHPAIPVAVIAVLVASLAVPLATPAAAFSVVTFSGIVTGPGGTGLPNIGVYANTGNPGEGGGTQTALDGTFSFWVPSGTYTLGFHDPDGAHVDGCYDAGVPDHFSTNWTCTPLSVPPGSGGITVAMPIGFKIDGTVTESNGITPLPNLGVNANAGPFGFGSQTSPTGSYSMTVLPGTYTIQFNDNRGLHVDGCFALGFAGNFSTDWDSCKLVSVAADVTVPNVAVPLGFHIRGMVRGPLGEALPDIGVNASVGDNWAGGTQTASDGTFSLTILSGTYTLHFNDNSGTHVDGCYVAAPPDNFSIDWNACGQVSVPPDANGISVVMPPGFHISGTVTGSDGPTGLANIGVNANIGDVGAGGTQTADDGTWSLTVLPGAYTVQFHDNSGAHVDGCYLNGGFSTDQGACTPVVVTATDRTGIDVVMPPGFHIRGTVTGSNGDPLPNIDVGANTDTFGAGTQTDGDGHYSLTVLPGDYVLQFHDNGGTYVDGCYAAGLTDNFSVDWNVCTQVSVATVDRTVLDVALPAGFHINGTVTDEDGHPLPNIDVGANTDTSGTGTQTAADGTYSLTVLSGSYTLQFSDNSGAHVGGCYAEGSTGSFVTDWNACTSVIVTAADRTGISVEMPSGVVVSGTVTAPNGDPLMNIDANANADTFGAGTQTDAYGRYSMTVLPNAAYVITFHDNSGAYVDGCYATGATGSFTTDWNACTPVLVAGSDVGGNDVMIPTSARFQSITFPNPGPLTMAELHLKLIATASSGLRVTLASTTPAVCTLRGTTVTFVAPGECSITASQAGNRSFDPATPVTQTFTISKASQSISFPNPGPATMAKAQVKVNATATSALKVTLTSTTLAVCTVKGTTVTLVAAGDCSITASQAGNAAWDPATPVTQTFTISKGSQTISFGGIRDRRLAQSPFTVRATSSSRLPVTFTTSTPSICTAGGANGATITLVGRGTCTIDADQPGNASYNSAPGVSQTFIVN